MSKIVTIVVLTVVSIGAVQATPAVKLVRPITFNVKK